MTHLDDGALQAFLDDELPPAKRAAVAEHLLGCEACHGRYEALAQAHALFTRAVSLLDVELPTARRADLPKMRGRPGAGTSSFVKAAILVLVVAAAASAAVPGSPVREWVAQVIDPAPEPAQNRLPAGQPVGERRVESVAPTGAVVGVVRSAADARPLAYARVQVVGDTLSDWTDEGGGYRLEGLERGERQLRVVHGAHDSLELIVEVPGDRPIRLDVTLSPLPGPAPEALADFEPLRMDYTLPALLNQAEMAALMQRLYPEELTRERIGGEAVLRLWLDERGQVVRSVLSSSSGEPALDAVALTVSDRMRFRPARSRQGGVRVNVLIPVLFTVPDTASADSMATARRGGE